MTWLNFLVLDFITGSAGTVNASSGTSCSSSSCALNGLVGLVMISSGTLVLSQGVGEGSNDVHATLWSDVLVKLLADVEFVDAILI